MNGEEGATAETQPSKRPPISKPYPDLRAPPQLRYIPKITAKNEATTSSSLLERLPPEIRNVIYEMVLVEPDRVLCVCTRHSDCAGARVASHALTQVSHGVRSECVRMWYERNVFEFHSMRDLEVWIRMIADEGKWLKKIVLAEGTVEVRIFLLPYCTDC